MEFLALNDLFLLAELQWKSERKVIAGSSLGGGV